MASIPFSSGDGRATAPAPAADRPAADHRHRRGRLRLVPAVGDAGAGRRSHRRAGQGHPVEQGPADPGGRAGDDQRIAGALGPARSPRAIAGAARRYAVDLGARPDRGRDPVADRARGAARRARAPDTAASVGGDEAALSAVRRQALSSRVAALRSSAEQRRREAAEANATITSLQGSLALAQQAGRRCSSRSRPRTSCRRPNC